MKLSEIIGGQVEAAMLSEASRLPMAIGQQPFWKKPLSSMTRRLELGNWDKGGCFAFAEALVKVFGGELWGFCSFQPADKNGGDNFPVEHAVAKIGDRFYDYSGMVDVSKILKRHPRWTLKPQSDPGVFWFEDEFVGDDDWETLLSVLSS